MTKVILLLLQLFLFSLLASGQDYNATTVPMSVDKDAESLRKINKILNDAKTGSAPLVTSGGSTPASVAVTPAFTSNTSNGSTTAGVSVIIFIFSSDFTGTIGGVAFSGSTDGNLQLRAPNGATLNSISYTRTAGTIRLVQY